MKREGKRFSEDGLVRFTAKTATWKACKLESSKYLVKNLGLKIEVMAVDLLGSCFINLDDTNYYSRELIGLYQFIRLCLNFAKELIETFLCFITELFRF